MEFLKGMIFFEFLGIVCVANGILLNSPHLLIFSRKYKREGEIFFIFIIYPWKLSFTL